MNGLRASILAALLALTVNVQSAAAVPAAQGVDVAVTPVRLQIYPLGTARVQMVLANPSAREQVFVLEILLVRADGSIATAYLSDAVSMAPGASVTAIYTVLHADGAVEALVTPRPWPELAR